MLNKKIYKPIGEGVNVKCSKCGESLALLAMDEKWYSNLAIANYCPWCGIRIKDKTKVRKNDRY